MSDAPISDQQPQEAPNAKKRPAQRRRLPTSRWVWVVGLLLIIGFGAQQLVTVRFWETLDNEAGQIATVDGRLTTLEAAMADQTRLRDDVQQMQQALQQERALLGLDRIEQQIDAGWQIWQGTGNTKTLVVALQNAQRSLANEPGAPAQALRLAIGRDLVVLKSQQVLDLRLAVENIDIVIASIDKLPLVQDRRVPADNAIDANPADEPPLPATLLERGRLFATAIAQEIWQAIRGMIRVQRLDHAEAGLIAPEQKVFLQQGLRLLLLDARHALIMRNAAVYQQTLGQARAWMMKYADTADALVKDDLATLQKLMALNVDPAAISLEESRKALVAARSALSGEPVAADDVAQEAASPSTESAKAEDAGKAQDSAKGSAQ